jgi:hypothetical protein
MKASRVWRALELGGRLIMTPEEAAEADKGSKFRPAMRVNCQPRTSFITNPANGRVPPMKPGATPDRRRHPLGPGEKATDGPELQAVDDRCILPIGNNAGPAILPLPNNSNYQIVQTRDHVVVVSEMIHDARIVRLNGRHRTDGQRPYLGDSIGWYEGDTLVVETVNFPPEQLFRGSWMNLNVTERFSRTPDGRLLYRFAVEDPTKWDQPWGGEYEVRLPVARSASTPAGKAKSPCPPCSLPPGEGKRQVSNSFEFPFRTAPCYALPKRRERPYG